MYVCIRTFLTNAKDIAHHEGRIIGCIIIKIFYKYISANLVIPSFNMRWDIETSASRSKLFLLCKPEICHFSICLWKKKSRLQKMVMNNHFVSHTTILLWKISESMKGTDLTAKGSRPIVVSARFVYLLAPWSLNHLNIWNATICWTECTAYPICGHMWKLYGSIVIHIEVHQSVGSSSKFDAQSILLLSVYVFQEWMGRTFGEGRRWNMFLQIRLICLLLCTPPGHMICYFIAVCHSRQ